jgi:hypothetical protein
MATAFWIATAKYAHEAARSAATVHTAMPHLKRVLYTPDPVIMHAVFDEIRTLPERRHPKWWFMDSAFYFWKVLEGINDDKLIYFDTDTYMCYPIDDVLEMLGRFDIVASHAPGRLTSKPSVKLDIPDAFPEVNVGVMGILRSDYTIRLMEKWYEVFKEAPEKYNNNDQGPLRQALWDSERVRLYILPPEYNCRWGFGGYAKYQVKVLHGRTHDYERVCDRVNHNAGAMRGWDRGAMD